MNKNLAEKQFDSVVKVLGSLAFESVFVYYTASENWTEIRVRENNRKEIAAMFGKDFSPLYVGYDPESIFLCNNKLVSSREGINQ